MKLLRHPLNLPLLFGALVIVAGVTGRLIIDKGQVGDAGGTPGMLLWILSPALLAWVFSRLDPLTRQGHGIPLKSSIAPALGAGLGASLAMLGVMMTGLAAGGLSVAVKPIHWASVAPLAITVCVFAALEEAAWRGYLMPSLMLRAGYGRVLVLGALIWGAWHLPYLDVLLKAYTDEPLQTLAPRLALGFLAMQFLYMELYLRWPSMWPAFAVHAGMNLSGQIALGQGLHQKGEWAWVFSPSSDGLLVMLSFAACGALFLRARVKRSRSSATFKP